MGCDNTTEPLTTYRPRAVLLPDEPPTHGEFAWLDYSGRWGQREDGFNNGPAGPNTKKVWREPFMVQAFLPGEEGVKSRLSRKSRAGLGDSVVTSVTCRERNSNLSYV